MDSLRQKSCAKACPTKNQCHPQGEMPAGRLEIYFLAQPSRNQKKSPPPSPPRSCEKIQAAGNWGAWGCPGKGKIPAVKTGVFFSVARSVFNPRKPYGSLVCIYKSFRKLPASLCGSPGSASRPCISRRVLAAGIFPFPGQRKRLLLLPHNFFTASPLEGEG